MVWWTSWIKKTQLKDGLELYWDAIVVITCWSLWLERNTGSISDKSSSALKIIDSVHFWMKEQTDLACLTGSMFFSIVYFLLYLLVREHEAEVSMKAKWAWSINPIQRKSKDPIRSMKWNGGGQKCIPEPWRWCGPCSADRWAPCSSGDADICGASPEPWHPPRRGRQWGWSIYPLSHHHRPREEDGSGDEGWNFDWKNFDAPSDQIIILNQILALGWEKERRWRERRLLPSDLTREEGEG